MIWPIFNFSSSIHFIAQGQSVTATLRLHLRSDNFDSGIEDASRRHFDFTFAIIFVVLWEVRTHHTSAAIREPAVARQDGEECWRTCGCRPCVHETDCITDAVHVTLDVCYLILHGTSSVLSVYRPGTIGIHVPWTFGLGATSRGKVCIAFIPSLPTSSISKVIVPDRRFAIGIFASLSYLDHPLV